MKNDALNVSGTAEATPPAEAPATRAGRWRSRRLSPQFNKLSGIYLIVALVIVFSITENGTFFTFENFRVVIGAQAITGLLTLGLLVSLVSGVFDLSIAANMTWSVIFVAWLQIHGVNWIVSVVVTLAVGALIGVANAVIVTILRVDSVIGTLGMSSILAAVTYVLTAGNSISSGINQRFISIGSSVDAGLPFVVWVFLGVALILWYVLECTPLGRYLYAVGFNMTAARLAGVRVVTVQWIGLVTSATLASLVGVVFTADLNIASYGAGDPYLLSAFAAAFLGATQIRPGRFNVIGTVVALYLLGVGTKGLQLAYPAQVWITQLFQGLALIVAVAIAARSARRRAAK